MGKKIGKYELSRTLGSGAFSKVKLGTDVRDGSKWAVKMIDKEQLAREHLEEQLKREIAIMKSLKHPHVVHLREVMQTANHIYMVLEVIVGGELFDKIVEAKKFPEDTGRRYFQQLVAGVRYCHQQGIAHRDIKPENLLLDERDNLKISDFGLSNLQPTNRAGLLQTVCGTPNYVAPEVLKEKGYDGFKADAWSCGVVLFTMLAGFHPFDDCSLAAVADRLARGDLRVPPDVTDGAKDVISKLLVVDPTKRMSLEETMNHPWFQVGAEEALKQFRSAEAVPAASPTEAELKSAIQDEAEEEDDASPRKPAVSGAAGPNDTLDAFGIIGKLSGVVVGSAPAGAPAASGKTYNFLVALGQTDITKAFQAFGCNAKAAGEHEVRGFLNSSQGLLTFSVVYAATAVANMTMVTVTRGRGDPLAFNDFMGKYCKSLGDSMRSPFIPDDAAE